MNAKKGEPISAGCDVGQYLNEDTQSKSPEKEKKASEILKEEYPTIYDGYMSIMEEQLELFSKKHLDYGMHNITAGTSLANEDERSFALTGLWYRISDKVNRWKNMIITGRKAQNETLIDTYQDLTNYGIIAQLVERGMWKND
jgi:hypothetical protein